MPRPHTLLKLTDTVALGGSDMLLLGDTGQGCGAPSPCWHVAVLGVAGDAQGSSY